MHAQHIIQNLLDRECPDIHAKRRQSVVAMAQAGSHGSLHLMGLSRHLSKTTTIRHRIKRCDRLLSNEKLHNDSMLMYGALCRSVLAHMAQPAIIVDWSDLTADRSLQLLRAALIVNGRALTLYEEVHPLSDYAAPKVHKRFLQRFKSLLPVGCRPVLITDAGFRSSWFKLLNRMGFAWIGRIRNRDMVRSAAPGQTWQGCKMLYARANRHPKDLGVFDYVRSNSVRCRLMLVKKPPCGRHAKTVFGDTAKNARSRKQAKGQTEPWLLAVSPLLAHLTARQVVSLYGGRMQIEQTFRDTKNPRWGLGLSQSQTRKPRRYAMLLLIGALVIYALWIIGLAARQQGFSIAYGSREKAAQTLSVISLARWWLQETTTCTLSSSRIRDALAAMNALALTAYI